MVKKLLIIKQIKMKSNWIIYYKLYYMYLLFNGFICVYKYYALSRDCILKAV